MFGLSYLLDNPTPYFAFLDDDDMFELTAYEKCAWMLESNKNVSMCGSYVVGFGDKNYTWTHGFHSGVRVVIDNPLTGSEVARFSILEATGCEFDEDLKTGMEDWDFYLCVASKGLWGATIPEYLFWYRQNPTALRQQRWGSLFEGEEKTAERIRKRYSSLEHNFPKVHVPPTEEFEQMNLTLPFANKLRLRKSVLFIIPWMSIGGGDTANLRLIEEMSRKGYRITIVCTMLNLHDNSMASKPLFMQYTHDIFTIPAMVRLADAPRFFSYLVESRGVGRIILCNSQLGYGILPWLSSKYKDIVFIDYVHNEEPDWKNGGYAAFSTVHQHSLDATFTSSRSTRQFMIEHGRQPDNLHVGYLGIDLSHLHPLQDEEKAATRTNLGIPLEATVVIYLARMVEHKQPRVALESFLKVMKNIASEDGKGISSLSRKYRLVMIGDGPMLREVTRLAKEHSELVMIFGSLEHSDALKYLSVSDVFCLPSTSEGVSFALAESMAFGVTALTSNVGGFSDLLYESGSYGVMVNATGNIVTDNDAFAKELKTLLGHAKLRDEMGTRAAQRVRAFFNADQRIPDLVKRMLSAKRTRAVVHTAEDELSTLHYTQSTVIRDVGVFSDYGEIHRSMQGKERNAFGTKYRAVCGEYNEVLSRLIDILEEPSGCDPDMELDVEKFQNAALEQCGRWCVMNYDDPKRQSGWQVKESCQGVDLFSGANHKCSKWFHSIQK